MRFFVRMTERQTVDAQELVAMLRHRLESIAYQKQLLEDGGLAYAFRTVDGGCAILMYEVETLEQLDRCIKRDPHFPYSANAISPVVNTEALVREAQEYLGEWIFSEEELPALNFPPKRVQPEATYWLVYKEVKPFSPLLPEAEQNDIHRRTVLAQRGHFEPLEFADDNPVGQPVGILVAEGELDAAKAHVENCEVFPDTVVTYTELLSLERAWVATVCELGRLGRSVPAASPWSPAKAS